eukprot:TRINITY_DN20460_c0_g1_i4.p1 TRINITY_DN20460_c0_g1~~TRINITY_DN20460_c0_g1_i4.p1  ORF type:complete len:108 (+),score=19.35 TRINITY_DN20460_c0_g1_i4:326-649(+)
MLEEYPDFFIDINAIYALGTEDADGNPPKVDWPHFQKVCKECCQAKELDLRNTNCQNIIGAYSVFEPLIHMNKPRAFFKEVLPKLGVKVLLNTKVDSLEVEENNVLA